MFRIAGLFAGIGGIEQGFARAYGSALDTVLLCESWDPATAVLRTRFPHAKLHPDVRELRSLPARLDVLTAGFPCTDLSQAGRTAGIAGSASGLVSHVFEALRLTSRRRALPALLIENVPNMLVLDKGRAMHYLIQEIESLGYRWAYRTVDSRFTGVPQRRRRVILLASTQFDPRSVLFADDAGARSATDLADNVFGFYWTEGRGGLGWAIDAVPTLKGGSTIGIPSPPGIWLPEPAEAAGSSSPASPMPNSCKAFRATGPTCSAKGSAATGRAGSWSGTPSRSASRSGSPNGSPHRAIRSPKRRSGTGRGAGRARPGGPTGRSCGSPSRSSPAGTTPPSARHRRPGHRRGAQSPRPGRIPRPAAAGQPRASPRLSRATRR